ncbi:hypothetical protein LCGC14_2455970, partial [marine sediment metagenome]
IFYILDLFLIETELFYNDVDHYFYEEISDSLNISEITPDNVELVLKDAVSFLSRKFEELGLNKLKVENRFSSNFLCHYLFE